MPSEHTHAPQDPGYEPEEAVAALFGEDPARFLENGELLAIARIRGINDVDLLRAYAGVEADRYGRQSVIAAVNQRLSDMTELED